MGLDQAGKQAIDSLHWGATLPMWGNAVRIQLNRLLPRETLAVQLCAAYKAQREGCATPEQEQLVAEAGRILASDPDGSAKTHAISWDPVVFTDCVFLLIAIRGVLAIAYQSVKQLKPLGQEADAKLLMDQFEARFGDIRQLRDTMIHNHEYVVGGGRDRSKALDPDQGITITQDDEGRLHCTWGGNHDIQLIEAGAAAVTLEKDLIRQYWPVQST